jgi:hypothetical protein
LSLFERRVDIGVVGGYIERLVDDLELVSISVSHLPKLPTKSVSGLQVKMEWMESATIVSLIISDIEYTYASQLKTVNWTRDMWG